MPSLIQGYEFDIFISYRQKDNKGDKWVTHFVEALKSELEATFKEDLSIYFDENPHDGLLETHNVDKSLEGKLKCLVFIPIISQTFCDTHSFAWEHEFCAFNRIAKEDLFGRDIKLNNGNVASRVLPVKIHELDADDKSLLENELGGVIRAVEFIYKEAGVNRPLRSNEESLGKNQNQTVYRNQINKTANAVKDLILAMKNFGKPALSLKSDPPSIQKQTAIAKSIVVLPFVNMSSDPKQGYFSDGLTEEIISDLSCLHDLLVISRSSAMTFKSSTKKVTEIASELDVRYVLEGSVRKAGNNLKVTAQLIDASTDTHVWTQKYSGTMDDIFDIQEKVSRAIVSELEIKITGKEGSRLALRAIGNSTAYDYYIRARRELTQWTVEACDRALKYLQMALTIEGPNALLLGCMAYTHWNYANIGIEVDENTRKTEALVNQTLELDPQSPDAHLAMGLTNLAFKGRPLDAVKNFRRVIEIRPNDFDALLWLGTTYGLQGKPEKSLPYSTRMTLVDPLSSLAVCWPGFLDFYMGNFDKALQPFLAAHEMEPPNFFYIMLSANTLACCGKSREAHDFLLKNISPEATNHVSHTFRIFTHALLKEKQNVIERMTPEWKSWGKRDPQWAHIIAQMLAFAEMKEETLEWLESAVNVGFCNYPLLSTHDPIRKYLKGDPRFQKLLDRMKAAWDQFD